MGKKVHVNAQTTLFSKSGAWHNYAIDFTVDLKTGRTHFIDESAKLPICIYMFLHLLADIYEKKGIDPSVEEVQYVKEDLAIRKTRENVEPELEIVKTGKRYPLEQKVEGIWLNDSNIPSLVKYIRSVAQNDSTSDNYLIHQLCYRYNEEGYRLLNPVNSVVWHYTFK